MEYTVNGATLRYEAEGRRSWGNEHVLLDRAVDLSTNTLWRDKGFTIENLFDTDTYNTFIEKTESRLLQCWKDAGLAIENNFQPDQYHVLASDFKTHLTAVEKTKLLPVEEFPLPVHLIEERVSEICKVPVRAKNPFDGQSVFHFRVIRPKQADNNPLHRDVWLEDYDDCINLYIPIAGSNAQSSLILIPGSHRWPESRMEKTDSGANVNSVKFNVPAVTAISGAYEVVRPDPQANQLLIFSPYLIHGGSVNLNTDKTRISIEMRFWKK